MNWYKLAQLSKGFLKSLEKKMRNSLQDKNNWTPEELNWTKNMSESLKNTKFFAWLLNQTRNGSANIQTGEDDAKILEKLTLFNELSTNNKIKQKDINKFKTNGDLAKYLEPFSMQDAESRRGKKRRLGMEGAVPVHKDGNIEIIRLDNDQAAAKLCRGTEWCIKDPQYFNEHGPPFYMFYMNEQPYSLLHVKTGQFKDVYDHPMSAITIPPILNALQSFMEKDPNAIDLNKNKNSYNELNIIPKMIKKKKMINDKIRRGDEKAIIKGLPEDLSAYYLIDDENKTEGIINVATTKYNENVLRDIDNVENFDDDMPYDQTEEEEWAWKDGFKTIEEIPKEILQRFPPETIQKIKQFGEKQFKEDTFKYDYFSDNLKDILGQDEIINIWIDKIKDLNIGSLDSIPEEIFNSIPDDKKTDLIYNYISPKVLSDKRMNREDWEHTIPNFIKDIFPGELKQKIALMFYQDSMTRPYNTKGQNPRLPKDLIQYIPEDQRIKSWSRMLNSMPRQFNMVPEALREKIDKQELVTGWMKNMSYHSIATYKEMPEDIKQLVPIEYVKEKFLEDIPRRYNYMKEEDWNVVRSIVNDQEIQTILNDIKKRTAMPSKYHDGYFFEGDNIESNFAKEDEKINRLPSMYRQELFNIVEQIKQQVKLELSQQPDNIAFGRSWFKRA